MNSTELLERFRLDIDDSVSPYLWTDEEILGYMSDAYMQFWRLVGGIGDMTSDDASLVVAVDGEEFSDLHSSILAIRAATLVSTGRPLQIVNYEDLPLLTTADDYGLSTGVVLDSREGVPQGLVLGLERNKVRWTPIPDADYDVRLLVYRLPLEAVTAEDQEFSELDVMHHLHLLKWMKAMAYQKQDAETFDRGRAQECEGLFRQYCAQVKAEWDRYRHKPRMVRYGGLPMMGYNNLPR